MNFDSELCQTLNFREGNFFPLASIKITTINESKEHAAHVRIENLAPTTAKQQECDERIMSLPHIDFRPPTNQAM